LALTGLLDACDDPVAYVIGVRAVTQPICMGSVAIYVGYIVDGLAAPTAPDADVTSAEASLVATHKATTDSSGGGGAARAGSRKASIFKAGSHASFGL
jgi:hypothetical protein